MQNITAAVQQASGVQGEIGRDKLRPGRSGRSVAGTCRDLLWVAIASASTACTTALEPGYYLHLAAGQLQILWECRSIEELLDEDGGADERTRQRLTFVREVCAYAGREIGLSVNSNYSCYFDTGGSPISWNVSASPPERFEPYRWSFPIVGALPYKGFFERSLAIAHRDSLQARGYDVVMRPVSAYSTLGYFSDPVLSTMTAYSDEALADLIFHELTHATVFVEGHTDFNESLASFVGKTGSLLFMSERHGGDGDRIRQITSRRRDAALFRKFLFSLTTRLDSLYSEELPKADVLTERRRVFKRAQSDYGLMRQSLDNPERHDSFLDWEINNARLLSYRRYQNLDIFERRYDAGGRELRAVVAGSVACAEAEDPWGCLDPSSDRESSSR